MKLTSDGNTAYLRTDKTGGVYANDDTTDASTTGVKLLNLTSGSELSPTKGIIKLDGKAGQAEHLTDNKAVSDEFVLTLKIKKADKQ